MSDSKVSQGTEQPKGAEPVDWETKYNELKADSRKWEDRSKSNYEELQNAQSALAASEEKLTSLNGTVEELTGKVDQFEQEKAHSALVADVAQASGVDASVLRGTTKEELEAHAESLKSLLKPSAPVINAQAKVPGEQPSDPEREAVRGLFGNE